MIVVGLTGGIGSGKTTVARMFEDMGVPIYIADKEAKRLMNTSKVIRRKLIALFGDDAYLENQLNRPFIASKIFNDTNLLNQMNAIVHPKVGKDFIRWMKKQDSKYVIKEAAIIFEHKKESDYDYIVTVTASLDDKMTRVMNRDNTTKKKVLDIVNNQMPDEEKIKKSDFVIVNEYLENTKKQVIAIHRQILEKISKF
ncbi:dephospho-CoA kinase [Subsaxibacter sp. CAU 1640]|uniref:dephospho-CoA kinase n=1 Tax=Subsaxibacter sp. CAU 1640 TaxID=2933271 RepID=UPI002002ED20|nr:dephospho-CoA kinase [Subsaxibacter sp. CAU 1640]MCK7590828.1 dephospho-CoA kinase [Subsaxibacter sp. CAU 1640]